MRNPLVDPMPMDVIRLKWLTTQPVTVGIYIVTERTFTPTGDDVKYILDGIQGYTLDIKSWRKHMSGTNVEFEILHVDAEQWAYLEDGK